MSDEKNYLIKVVCLVKLHIIGFVPSLYDILFSRYKIGPIRTHYGQLRPISGPIISLGILKTAHILWLTIRCFKKLLSCSRELE